MKKAVMTKKELDQKNLNRTPKSGFYYEDGFLFLFILLAYRKNKKYECIVKLRTIDGPEFDQNIYI